LELISNVFFKLIPTKERTGMLKSVAAKLVVNSTINKAEYV
jgi:hypothetical protein